MYPGFVFEPCAPQIDIPSYTWSIRADLAQVLKAVPVKSDWNDFKTDKDNQ